MLEQIRVVLVNTSHPGNIGSAARAMKVMGLKRLVLVDPKEFPSDTALFMSSGAEDVVNNAQVVSSYAEAIGDCQLVLGASARQRSIPWPVLSPRAAGEHIVGLLSEHQDAEKEQQPQVALVFGREASGLTNEELTQCHYHIHIEGSPEYSVLNLAMAVQVVSYEIFQAWLAQQAPKEAESQPTGRARFQMPMQPCRWDVELATQAELNHFIEHMGRLLAEIEFYDPENPKQILARLRRMFTRMQPDQREIKLLRGVLTAKLKSKQNLEPTETE